MCTRIFVVYYEDLPNQTLLLNVRPIRKRLMLSVLYDTIPEGDQSAT